MDISAIQFEVAQLHFLGHVFVTVAVVVAQTPYRRYRKNDKY